MDKFPSIEKLAAYFDGNLPKDEMLQISKMAEENGPLHKLMEDYAQIEDTELSYLEQNTQLPDDIVGEGFRIPDIDNLEIISPVDDSFWNDEGLFNQGGFFADELNQVSETLKNSNEMETIYRTYGEHGENIKDPIFILQPDDHSCGLRSQQIVLRDFGIDIPFDTLEQIAKDAGVYSDKGTLTYDIGKVMEMAGVGMHQVQGSTIYDLTAELAQGHRVIVSVDADELWHNYTGYEKMTNWVRDIFGEQGGNHALIVAGVEVNPKNPSDVKVVLTDPGSGHLRIEYPLDQFMNAWKDSNCFMAATDDAAPYQYDAATRMEIPSNFSSDYLPNQFVIDYGYQLSPDWINYPLTYQPAFTGHIDMIGGLTYDDYTVQLDSSSFDLNSVLGNDFAPNYDGGALSKYYANNGDYDDLALNQSVLGGADDGAEATGPVGAQYPSYGDGVDSYAAPYLDNGVIVGSGDSVECAGSVGNAYLGDGGAESAGSAGASYLGDDGAESAGSAGNAYLGDESESAGSAGALYLGDGGAESAGSVGDSYLGDGNESAGSVG